MASKTHFISKSVRDYVAAHSARPDALLEELRAVTGRESMARMQIAPEQGAFLALIVKVLGANRAIEIGTFTGYSAICIARSLGPEGRLLACDVSEEWTAVARRYWAEAGVAHKIDLRLAPALETLDGLLADGQEESFDFAFVDADKENYPGYAQCCLALLRPGGLLAVDNTLWNGLPADPAEQSVDTVAIRAFNRAMHEDSRVTLSMLPVGDGLTLARKREAR